MLNGNREKRCKLIAGINTIHQIKILLRQKKKNKEKRKRGVTPVKGQTFGKSTA